MAAHKKVWPQEILDDLANLTTEEMAAKHGWNRSKVENTRNDVGVHMAPAAVQRASQMRGERLREKYAAVEYDEPLPDRMTWEAFDQLFSAISDIKAAEDKYDPRRYRIGVKLPGTKPVGLIPSGDWQLGSEGVSYSMWRADMAAILEFRKTDPEGLYGIGMGDYQSALGNLNIRGSQHRDIVKAGDQFVLLQQFFHLTKGTWLVLLTGCHDTFTTNKGAIDPVERYCELSGARHAGHGVELDIQLGKRKYVTRLRHRYRFNSSLNPLNSQRRQVEMEGPADLVIHAHLHTVVTGDMSAGGRRTLMLRSGSYQVRDAFASQYVGNVAADPFMPLAVLWPDGTQPPIAFPDFHQGLDYLASLRA